MRWITHVPSVLAVEGEGSFRLGTSSMEVRAVFANTGSLLPFNRAQRHV